MAETWFLTVLRASTKWSAISAYANAQLAIQNSTIWIDVSGFRSLARKGVQVQVLSRAPRRYGVSGVPLTVASAEQALLGSRLATNGAALDGRNGTERTRRKTRVGWSHPHKGSGAGAEAIPSVESRLCAQGS